MFQDLKPYDAYGNPASAWIPAFPASWNVKPGAGVLFEVRDRNDGLRESTVLSLSYGRVIVKPTDKLHGLVPASFETYQILEPGDIVFRPTDLQNDQRSIRVGAVEDRGIITSAYIGLRPRGIDPQFAFLYLRVLDYLKVFYGMGSGLRQNIDVRDFKRLPIPVPPVEEQGAIVTYLAHAHQRINMAIATKRRLIALLTEYGSLVTQEILAGRVGSDASALVDSRSEQLGLVPEDWRLVRVGVIVRGIQTGPFGSQLHANEYVAGGVPVVNPKHIVGGRILPEEAVTISEVRARSLARHRLRAGDVIAARRGELGRSAVVQPDDEGAVCGTGSVVIRIDESQVTPEYFQRVFSSPQTRGQLEEASRGATMPNLNEGMIARVRVALPPCELQKSVLGAVDEEVSKQGRRISAVSREIELLEEFRTRLTADVVTGQVDVRSIAATLPPIELADVFANSAGAVDTEVDETADEAGMEDE